MVYLLLGLSLFEMSQRRLHAAKQNMHEKYGRVWEAVQQAKDDRGHWPLCSNVLHPSLLDER